MVPNSTEQMVRRNTRKNTPSRPLPTACTKVCIITLWRPALIRRTTLSRRTTRSDVRPSSLAFSREASMK